MDHYYQIKGLFGEAYTDPRLESYTTLGYFVGLTEKPVWGADHAPGEVPAGQHKVFAHQD